MGNYAFIDGQNLHLGTRGAGWIVDYRKFRIYLEEKYNVEKAFYFIGYLKGNEKLYDSLEFDGYELIFKPTYYVNGELKGNVDAELVLQVMLEINNFDKAVIVAGDGDYHCIIKHLKENQKLRIVLVPDKNKISELIPTASGGQFNTMNQMYEKIGFAKL